MYITKKYTTGCNVPFYVTGSLRDIDGKFHDPTTISSTTYTIYELIGGEWSVCDNYQEVQVSPADCFYTATIDENLSSGKSNFRHIIPGSEDLFAKNNGKYRVDYRIYPMVGEVFGFTIYVNVI